MHARRHKMSPAGLERDEKSISARQQRCRDAECKGEEGVHFECCSGVG